MTAMLRPVCWLWGHRWTFASSLSGPINRCARCGAIQLR
jgi:hypothetical protein